MCTRQLITVLSLPPGSNPRGWLAGGLVGWHGWCFLEPCKDIHVMEAAAPACSCAFVDALRWSIRRRDGGDTDAGVAPALPGVGCAKQIRAADNVHCVMV